MLMKQIKTKQKRAIQEGSERVVCVWLWLIRFVRYDSACAWIFVLGYCNDSKIRCPFPMRTVRYRWYEGRQGGLQQHEKN
jgi:hypothetical protein